MIRTTVIRPAPPIPCTARLLAKEKKKSVVHKGVSTAHDVHTSRHDKHKHACRETTQDTSKQEHGNGKQVDSFMTTMVRKKQGESEIREEGGYENLHDIGEDPIHGLESTHG
jgi:hypothetical protein